MSTLSLPRSLPLSLSPTPSVERAGTVQTDPCQRWLDVEGRRYVLRALDAHDAALLGGLWNDDLSRAARRMRFHASLGRIGPDRLQACCRLAPVGGQAFILTQLLPGGEKALGEGRWAWTPQAGCAELSVSVADAWQGRGLGRRLVKALLLAAQAAGAQTIHADVLCDNEAMRVLLRQCGFVQRAPAHAAGLSDELDDCADDTLSFVKDLLPQPRNPVWAAHDAWPAARSKVVAAQCRRWLAQLTAAGLALRLLGSDLLDAGCGRLEHPFGVQN